MPDEINLADLPNPQLKIKLPDGDSFLCQTYDLYDLIEKGKDINLAREKQHKENPDADYNAVKENIDDVRSLFGFPLTLPDGRIINITNNQAIALWVEFKKYADKEEAEAKKQLG